MDPELKLAANDVAESAKDLVEKLEALAKVAATQAEPLLDEALAKIRELADKAEAALKNRT